MYSLRAKSNDSIIIFASHFLGSKQTKTKNNMELVELVSCNRIGQFWVSGLITRRLLMA